MFRFTKIEKLLPNRFAYLIRIRPGIFLDAITNYIYFLSLLLLVAQTLYIYFYFSYLPPSVPLWNFLNWGVDVLASKQYIFIFPLLSSLTVVFCIFISVYYMKYNLWSVSRFVSYFSLLSILMYSLTTLSIVEKSKLVNLRFGSWFYLYLGPAILAFFITFIVSRLLIKNGEGLGIIESPNLRDEPAKILQDPTPRSGAVAFWAGFAIVSGLFLWYSQRVWGLIAGTFLTTVTGYLDDRFKLSFLPRLILVLPISIFIIVLSGFVMVYIPNPFGEPFKLDSLIINLRLFNESRTIIVYAALASFIWLLWMGQMLSFNNGIDGQFVAISSVTALVIALLSFRFTSLTYEQRLSAQISFITLGAVLGLLIDTFPPQKIIWGWGATGVGLIFASLSLLSGTRVASAFLVLLIPSIDVIYVLAIRIKNGKSPFKGDRNHLHHKLLDLGWSKRKITGFYWAISISFGVLTYLTSGKSKALTTLMFAGIVLFALVLFRRYVDRKNGII